MNVSKKIKQLREAANISQTDLAKKLRVTRQAYNHYETGKRVPTLETLLLLSDIFRVDIGELLNDRDIIHKPNFIEKKELHNPNLIDMSELSKKSQKELHQYINLLKLRDKAENMNEAASEELEFKPKYQN